MAVGHYDDDLPATVREGIKQWVLLDRVWNPKTGKWIDAETVLAAQAAACHCESLLIGHDPGCAWLKAQEDATNG